MQQAFPSPESRKRLKRRVQRLLQAENYRPETKSGLARLLEVSQRERSRLRQVLGELEDEGKIECAGGGRYVLAGSREGGRRSSGKTAATGVLRIRHNGSGFVVLENSATVGKGVKLPQRVSIQIPRGAMANALSGDRVALQLTAKSVPRSWLEDPGGEHRVIDLRAPGDLAIDGRVTEVLERAEHRVIGTLTRSGKRFMVKPDSSTYPPGLELCGESSIKGAKNGERVLVEIVEWADPELAPRARLLERLGMPGQDGLAMREIVAANAIREHFPKAVVAEAQAISKQIPQSQIAGREDWRDRLVFTIDPEDARDFDDAISVRSLKDGGWELAVHIADVSTYVQPGSAMDKEAQVRGNSTYLPHRVIPMLPEELSNGICSLLPFEDRLTRCVVMEFDSTGKRGKTRFISAVIHSKARLTYEEAMAYIEGKPAEKGDPVPERILQSWELACLLRKKRFQRGGLDLDFPEIRVKLDASGRPVDLVVSQYDASHQLIEECMLVTNEAVAEELRKRGRPCIYRVHEDPAEERLLEFRELVRAAGLKVGDLSDRAEAQRLLDKAKGHPAEQAIKIGFLKSLKRADYRTEPVGHYGLAKRDYTHFTSPIRRYADLVVHRALYAEKGEPRMSATEMTRAAEHISRTERTSAQAEQDSQRLMQYEFFAGIAEREPDRRFPATVMECAGIGLFVEIDTWQVRGLVHYRDLPGRRAYFDRAAMCYSGLPGGKRLSMGDRVQVSFKTVDLVGRKLDFKLVGWGDGSSDASAPTKTKPSGKRSSRRRSSGGKSSAASAGSQQNKQDKQNSKGSRRSRKRRS